MNNQPKDTGPLLDVKQLSVRYPIGQRLFKPKVFLTAVDEISFSINQGETLAIVGESGSGKTTAALAVARLVEAWNSQITIDGQDLLTLSGEDLRQLRQKIQIIFQDPYSSLNPRQRAESIVREPLDSLSDKNSSEKNEIIDHLFKAVGLRPEQKRLFPHQFSGGQRQRIGIARALATRPKIIICDEPVSALDVAVQAQILNLLRQLQREFGLTYLFISHDLGVVQYMCDRVAVMYMGRIVEIANRVDLFSQPKHPYTTALLSAIPTIKTTNSTAKKRITLSGDPPDPINRPIGCRFASRCPHVFEKCYQIEPQLKNTAGTHKVACHLVNE